MVEKFIEMELREIQMVEDLSRSQIIVLAEKDGPRAFPIFIGFHEAMAMDLAARGEVTPRPLTHDLILNVIDGLGAQLASVMVVKLQHDTFLGALELRTSDGRSVRIDSRPSDAIVLATKRRAPIFVEEQVLTEIQRSAETRDLVSEEEDDDEPPKGEGEQED